MTYIAKRARVRMAPPRRAGLGSWWDDMMQQAGVPTADSQCLAQANATAAPLEARVTDLDDTWNPTGFYTVADLRQVVSSTMSVVQQGYSALAQALQSVQSDSLNEANAELSSASGKSLDYLAAATDAVNKGIATVNAPGLKRWAVSTMQSAADAIVAAGMATCQEPWWLSAIATYQQVFDAAWSVVKQIAGAVLKLGEVALKVPDLLDDVVTYAKWALLLGGALFMFSELNKAHGSHESGL
jgi:hypothetical protein